MFNMPTIAMLALLAVGVVVAAPVLIKGFSRRGKGVFYEQNFIIQRAPQFASLLTIALIAVGTFATNNLPPMPGSPVVSAAPLLPAGLAEGLSWLGVAILASGLVFMIGGWISLGECFSTDAEVMDGHTVRKDGLLALVMHPAYSGIIQSLFGAALAGLAWPAVVFTVAVVAPLWLNRAKYEEALLLKELGADYQQYAEELKWRRLIPRFIPIGV